MLSGAEAIAKKNLALIVGVSKYQNLPKELWLKGPRNDAILVRDFLISNSARPFEEDNIKVLADGVEGADIPTLAAIRGAMSDLAAEAGPGDFIYLHFSGHGTQAPARDPSTELDGLDELFLPADIGAWDNTVGTVTNALVDDEIGELIGAIQAKGAHIWAVFDSCHSGTVTRAASLADPLDREVSRKLSPAVLGISDAELVAARPTTRSIGVEEAGSPVESLADSPTSETGSFVAFYAAQTNQTTPEMRLPANKTPREPHGLFTFTILEAIAQNPGMSYRQLGQEILRTYSVLNRSQPTPLFEGDLDFGVFSNTEAAFIQQWPVKQTGGTLTITAGRLHGLSLGETLGMVETPAQTEVDENLQFKIETITDLTATLTPVSKSFVIPADTQFARKTETSIDYSFTIAKPLDEQQTPQTEALFSALDTFEQAGLRLEITDPETEADVQFVVRDNNLWFVGRDGILVPEGLNKTPSISMEDKSADAFLAIVGDNLARMARANNLIKLGGIFRPSAMGVDLEFTAQNTVREEPLVLDAASVSKLVPGDIVFLKAKNTQRNPVDVNVLYIGSDFSISHIYAERLNREDSFDLDLFDVTGASLGRERILVVATPAAPQSAVEDLSWLEQSSLERTRGNQSELGGMLAEAGFASTTRAVKKRGGAGGGIAQILVDVVGQLE
ncbi:caspase family protein [Pararhizobium sp. IMCC21322]|uniref:caspase family protein n=1 Tax=Pararhizobium sp. IMCC21322 TaxID=3067903 RepID=UPI002742149C|nr:caspase family protein [Pararhizobium sp. IMCC21322]